MSAYSLPSRWILSIGALLTFLVLGGGIALACTIYWGTNTIEADTDGDGTFDTGEYTVVGDPGPSGGNGMDRCDGAGSGSVFTASNGDTVRVEIDAYNGPADCERSHHGDTDGDGNDDHSLADSDAEEVFVTTYNGDAYLDDDLDGVYEDNDLAQHGSEEPGGEPSEERVGDCMGDGKDDSGVNQEAGPFNVIQSGDDAGQFDPNGVNGSQIGDADSDGVYEVDVSIDAPKNTTSAHAGAVCVSESDLSDSAPQIPLEVS